MMRNSPQRVVELDGENGKPGNGENFLYGGTRATRCVIWKLDGSECKETSTHIGLNDNA